MTTSRQDLDVLIPIETSQEVIQAVAKTSAIEQVAPPETMTSDTKEISRFGGFTVGTVAKGAEYAYSVNVPDNVEMVARKVGGAAKIAEEDLVDTITGEGTMRRYEQEAGSSLAKHFDHACIGVTAAQNGTTVKYQSIYNTLATTQETPWGQYVANTNIVQIERGDFTGTVAQDAVIDFLAKYEESDFFDASETFVLASPLMRSIFRKVRDADGNPIFVPPVTEGGHPTIFGYSTARETVGCRTHAVDTQAPTGNPLVVIGNRRAIRRGLARTSAGMVPGNPGVQWQRAAAGIGFLSDEAIMKAMMRRAFVATVPQGLAILELTPTV